MEEEKIGISIFKVMDYIFCPRIIYYENVIGINTNKNNDLKNEEEERLKRINGINKKWIWDRLKVKNDKYDFSTPGKVDVVRNKEFNVNLFSEKNKFYGKIDEILYLKNEEVVPLHFFNSKYDGRIFENYKYQMAMYSMLIEENYKIESKKGYGLFLSGLILKKIEYNLEDFKKIEKYISEIWKIIENGTYPLEVESGTKCRYCYYKKICGK